MTITDRFKTPLDLEMEKNGWVLCDFLTYYGRHDNDIIDMRTPDIKSTLWVHKVKYQIFIDPNELDHSCKKLYVPSTNYDQACELITEIDRQW